MIDHFGINCADLPASAAFYDQVLGTLGYTRLLDFGVALGYGADKPDFWIGAQPEPGPASGPNREVHVAFVASDAAAVRAFFTKATDLGVTRGKIQIQSEGAEVLFKKITLTPLN